MLGVRLYLAQRLTALVMAPLVLGHLALMIYAIRGGLTVEEILGRTEGSWFWAGYYGLFVLTASVHGAIGLRVILVEWVGLRRGLDPVTSVVALGLTVMGLSAVVAVI